MTEFKAYINNLDFPLMMVTPSEMHQLLEKSKDKNAVGIPKYICVYPMPAEGVEVRGVE